MAYPICDLVLVCSGKSHIYVEIAILKGVEGRGQNHTPKEISPLQIKLSSCPVSVCSRKITKQCVEIVAEEGSKKWMKLVRGRRFGLFNSPV